MLNFHHVTCVSCPHFSNLYNLYILAFPLSERRSWAGLEFELSYEKRFCAYALVQNDKFVGLFNYWTFDSFFYIEHIAISPLLRGKSIGTEAMQVFMSQTKLPIILEVEMPTNPTAIGRINFYEKLGFSVVAHKYAQPPYEEDGFLIPMQLMTNDVHFAETHFEKIKGTLYNMVYHYDVEQELAHNQTGRIDNN